MKITTKPALRLNRQNSVGAPIAIRVTIDRKPGLIEIGKRINPEYWDSDSGTVKKGGGNSLMLNNYIRKELQKIDDIILTLQSQNKPISHKIIVELYRGKSEFFKDFVEGYLDRNPDNHTENRIYFIRVWLRQFLKFSPKLKTNQLNTSLIEKYIKFIKVDLGLKDNSLAGKLSILQKMIRIAFREKLISENPMENFQIRYKDGNRNVLEIDEILKLHELYLTPDVPILDEKKTKKGTPSGRELLGAFLFCFYAGGMRYSDYRTLKREHIAKSEIKYRPGKGGNAKLLSIPITDKLRTLIPEKDQNKPYVFKSYHNNRTANTNLKKILESVGIDRKITWHCSRHSFGTAMLELDTNLKTVKELMGHTRIETTEIYAKIKDKKKVEAMDKLNKM